MSRIGKSPVVLPEKVEVTLGHDEISVKGPLGTLTQSISPRVKIERIDNQLEFKVNDNSRQANALSGTVRALVANMVTGVTEGFEKRLEIQGVGYRALLRGRDIELQVGFSHPVPIKAPEGIEFEVPQPTRIIVKGNSKQQVGELAAVIRKQRPPEPYKGKGIRYEGEYVARKVGKRA